LSRASGRTLAVVVSLALVGGPLSAAGTDAGAYKPTGDAVLKANHWPFTVELLSVRHEMRDLPAERSRRAVIEFDGDKRLTVHALRAIDAKRLTSWLRDGYDDARYRDEARIQEILGAFSNALQKDEEAVIQYDAASRTTTVTVGRRAPVQVTGAEFMRATWAVWFEVGDGLVARL